jgi:hypothetical protein
MTVQYLLGLYLCDYGTSNCNPVCLDVSYEASDVTMSVSLLFQQAHSWPLENHRTPQHLCPLIPNIPVPVEFFHNCNDSFMRVAGGLRGSYYALQGHSASRQRGIILGQVHLDQMVLETIRWGRPVQ